MANTVRCFHSRSFGLGILARRCHHGNCSAFRSLELGPYHRPLQAALSGSLIKAPGFAGGYLLVIIRIKMVIAQTSPHRVDYVRWLAVKSEAREDFVIVHMQRQRPGHGMTEPQARATSYAACVHLDPLDSYDVCCDEQRIPTRPSAPARYILATCVIRGAPIYEVRSMW
jgi:hypothetical protein